MSPVTALATSTEQRRVDESTHNATISSLGSGRALWDTASLEPFGPRSDHVKVTKDGPITGSCGGLSGSALSWGANNDAAGRLRAATLPLPSASTVSTHPHEIRGLGSSNGLRMAICGCQSPDDVDSLALAATGPDRTPTDRERPRPTPTDRDRPAGARAWGDDVPSPIVTPL